MWESPRPVYPNELYHYGVKGMHWGIRRYQPYPKGYSGSGKYLGKSGGRIGGIPEIKKGFTKKMSEMRKNVIDDYAEEYLGVTCYEIKRDKVPFLNVEYYIDLLAFYLAGKAYPFLSLC